MISSIRSVPLVFLVLAFLSGCATESNALLRSRFESLIASEGDEYRDLRSAWLELPATTALPFLERVAAEAPTRNERLLAEATRLRLADAATWSRLVKEFASKGETARDSDLSTMHGGSRPEDPELAVTGLTLLWAEEKIPAPELRETRWDAICATVRLEPSPHWEAVLYEWAVKGWWETDAPAPRPRDFSLAPPPDVESWVVPVTGPAAPNGDVYTLFALELLARRGERAVRDALFQYLRTRAKYPLRVHRAAKALDCIASSEDSYALLEVAADRSAPLFLRGLFLQTLGKVGRSETIEPLRSLAEEAGREAEDAGYEEERAHTYIRVGALNAIDAIEARTQANQRR